MKYHHWPKLLVLISLFIASLNADAYRGLDREIADEKRVALVIGNSNYRQHYLPNPRNDATDMAQRLQKYGFTVIHKQDLNQRQFKNAVRDFKQRISKDGISLFYYAGHGIQIEGRNYLLPVGSDIQSAEDVEYNAIDAQWIVKGMNKAGSRVNIIILDACRNNPFRGFFRSQEGLAAMHAPDGTIISYATALGKKASDGSGRNGLYTEQLLAAIQTPGLSIEKVFKQTATGVKQKSGGQQVPWVSTSLTGKDFCFTLCQQAPSVDISQLLHMCKMHYKANHLTSGRGGTALACYEEVLKKEPLNLEAVAGIEKIEARYISWIKRALDSGQTERAKRYLASLRLVNPESPQLVDFEARLQASLSQISRKAESSVNKKVFRDRLKDGSLGPEMVWIPAGSFRMGDLQGGGNKDEKPIHQVSVGRFAMGRYEVTFAEYDKFAQATGRQKPSDEGWGRGNRPVINVSWHEATAYAKWLSQQTGQQYRLPTEAEWGYAARARTTTKYWWGNTASHEYANYGADSCCSGLAKGKDRWKYTSPVGSFEPNPFSLYDTVGNVWEWTCSLYDKKYNGKEQKCLIKSNSKSNYFVLRGGSWYNEARVVRSVSHLRRQPARRFWEVGFRLARLP